MTFVLERRACGVLFNSLLARSDSRPYLLPANVCSSVPLTFRAARASYRFVDAGADSPGMDREACLELIAGARGRFAGLVYVRPYGVLEDVGGFFAAAKREQADLLVVDDRCLASPDPGAHPLSPHADLTLWSTGRAKVLDLGGGGFARLGPGVPYRRHSRPFHERAAVAVERAATAAVVARRRFRGGAGPWLDLGEIDRVWEDFHQAVVAALLRRQPARERIRAIYRRGIPAAASMSEGFQTWRFQLLVPQSEQLVASLFANGLFASRHYASLGGVLGAGSFPRAERWHARVVNLFLEPVTVEMAERTVELVRAHLRRARPRPSTVPRRSPGPSTG